MYNLLKGKKGIIFGALDENSIAWKVAERAHEEGAEFVLTNAPIAFRLSLIPTGRTCMNMNVGCCATHSSMFALVRTSRAVFFNLTCSEVIAFAALTKNIP